MAKFIIGVDAFSDPESSDEREFITHTEYPKFIAEIIFVESGDQQGFKFESFKAIWNEPCDTKDLKKVLVEAEKAVAFYTQKSMELEF